MFAIFNKQVGKYEISHIEAEGALVVEYDDKGEVTNPELKAQILQEKLFQKRESEIKEALNYLNSTDWYYTRKLETGKEVPKDVVSKRVEFRDRLNKI